MESLGALFLGLMVSSRLLGGGGGKGNESIATYYVASRTAPNAPVIAVLPFRNLSEENTADKKFLSSYATQLLASGNFSVVDPTAVEKTIADLRVRGDIDAELAKQIGEKLHCPLLLMGTINEYGTPRSSSSQGLSVAVDTRLLDAQSTQTIWAASVSVTQQPKEPMFGPTQSPTLAGLTNKVVKRLVSSMVKEKDKIAKFSPRVVTQPAAVVPAVSGPARYLDESKAYSSQEIQALLVDLPGFKRDTPVYKKHFYDEVEAEYKPNGVSIRVKLVDYREVSMAETFIRQAAEGSATAEQFKLEGLPANSFTGRFQTFNLNVQAGRFGLYLRAPVGDEAIAKDVATRLVKSLT